MFNGSDANLATERLCRRPGSISEPDFQSVFAIRRGSCSFPRHRYLSTIEEGLPGSVGCQELYRPILNLAVISKLLERIVARQLVSYLSENDLLPDRQSAYRAFRSTETVIARLLSDIILTALDAGDIAALALLDLSAAFDTVEWWTTPFFFTVFRHCSVCVVVR